MTPSSWQDLRDRFLDKCYKEDATGTSRWLEIWHLLSQHLWFRENLAATARSVLRRSGCPGEWQQDIEQEASVLLARRLRRMPCLGIDPVQAEQHFAGWMGTIINRDCRDALRRLSRGSRLILPLPEHVLTSEPRVQKEACIDLATALDRLDKQEKYVLVMYSKGFTLQQIADELDQKFWATYRVYHRGLKRLRRLL